MPEMKSVQLKDGWSGRTLAVPEEALTRLKGELLRRDQVAVAIDILKDDIFLPIARTLPDRLRGRFVGPAGQPVARVRVRVPKPRFGGEEEVAWPVPSTFTDDGGAFDVDLPPGPLPDDGIRILVQGAGNTAVEVPIARGDLIGDGELGTRVLDRVPKSLPNSVVGSLPGVLPAAVDDVDDEPDAWADLQPDVLLGQGNCATRFRTDARAYDRFRFGMLFRLVDPQLWPKVLRLDVVVDGKPLTIPVPTVESLPQHIAQYFFDNGTVSFGDRAPIERPIELDRFMDTLTRDPAAAPKAGTLGIGYVLGMRQEWTPSGYSLGDLVYSLPLAPGEQQRIAIRERRESLAVLDREALSVSEQRAFDEIVDTSAASMFSRTLDEAGRGGSTWSQSSDGSSGGGGFSLLGFSFGGGGGSSSASGSSSSWSTSSRDFTASAVESFHGSLARRSATARQAGRVSVRLARASDEQEVTTRVIGNNNRMHALTVQYWEVLRHYTVTTRADDVTLVAFVPLQLIRWLPKSQSRELPDKTALTRAGLLDRYEVLHRYADEIRRRLPRGVYREGLRQLRRLFSTSNITVRNSSTFTRSFDITLKGTFLPFDHVTIDAIGRGGRRLGRVSLSPAGAASDFGHLMSAEEVLEAFRERRSGSTTHTLKAKLTLRNGVDPAEVQRFDVRSRLSPYTHTPDPEQIDVEILKGLFQFEASIDEVAMWEELTDRGLLSRLIRSFTLHAGRLRREVGGPVMTSLQVRIESHDSINIGEDDQRVLPAWLPIPATSKPPELTVPQLLHIEQLLQHVISEPVRYSQAVWARMDRDERAILLESYTIGVPAEAGDGDETQDIPLLNCVTNQVLGFFGNSMILPFHLPPEVERLKGLTTRDMQESLLNFHREGFQPRKTNLTLPTRGMLGEAVLGSCTSAEKIDLTRFWNWQDGYSSPVSVDLPESLPEGRLAGEQVKASSVTSGLLDPALSNLVPDAPASASKLLENALSAEVPWLSSKLPDPRGTKVLGELAKAALGEGDTPGVDRQAVNALMATTKTQASETALKLGTLASILNNDLTVRKESLEEAKKASEQRAEKDKEAETAAAGARTAGLQKLKEDADSYITFIAATPAIERPDRANELVRQTLGVDPSTLTTLERATLYPSYAPSSEDEDEVPAAKTALRTALGLP